MASLVRDLSALGKRSSQEILLSAGELVVTRLAGGDPAALRQEPARSAYRELLQHPELKLSRSVLSRGVALVELRARIPLAAASEHLTASHLQEVLGLEERDQRALLGDADEQRWSVAQLRKRARRFHERHRGRGRPVAPRVLRTLEALSKLTTDAFADDAVLEVLDADEAGRYRAVAASLARQLASVSNRLERVVKASDETRSSFPPAVRSMTPLPHDVKRRPQLVVVADNFLVARALCRALEHEGFRAHVGSDADLLSASAHFDCAIFDLGVHGQDSVALASNLIESQRAKVVVFRADDVHPEARARGADRVSGSGCGWVQCAADDGDRGAAGGGDLVSTELRRRNSLA